MKRPISLAQIATHVGGDLQGDSISINKIASLQSALAGDLSFVASEKHLDQVVDCKASALIVGNFEVPFSGPVIRCDNAYVAYASATHLFVSQASMPGVVHPSAVIDASAKISSSASIGANVVIEAGVVIGDRTCIKANTFIGEDTLIGNDCFVDANAVLLHGLTIGDRVRVGSTAVIGGEGFGFAPSAQGYVRICQLGGVRIDDDCDIGPGCTIDRGALDDTHLKAGVILDDQVHIAHNVVIGERTAMAACSGVAGSTHIGRDCTVAGMSGIVGHLRICDGVHVTAFCMITKSINKPGVYSSGTPMSDSVTWRKNAARFAGLDKWVRKVNKQLDVLSSKP